MKRLLLTLLALAVLACSCPLSLAEERLTDECASLRQREWAEYDGFARASSTLAADFQWAELPDGAGLLVRADQRRGTVEYQVQGAARLEVSYYLSQGDFAARSGGAPILGGEGEPTPLQWDGDRLYCSLDGAYWVYGKGEGGALGFLPCDAPRGELRPYGLTVSASRDGKNFTRLPGVHLRQREQRQQQLLRTERYYQVQRFQVPEGTVALRVELADWRACEGLPNPTMPPCLAQVDFYGAGLTTGRPAPSPSSSSTPPDGSGESSWDPDLNNGPPIPSGTWFVYEEFAFWTTRRTEDTGASEGMPSSEEPSSRQPAASSTRPVRGTGPQRSSSSSRAASSTSPPTAARRPAAGPPPTVYVAGGAGVTLSAGLALWLLLRSRK